MNFYNNIFFQGILILFWVNPQFTNLELYHKRYCTLEITLSIVFYNPRYYQYEILSDVSVFGDKHYQLASSFVLKTRN